MKKHPRQIPDPPKPQVDLGANVSTHALGQLKEVQAELKSRRIEALRLYEPMDSQQEMHACMASERIVLGGNRCIGADQVIYDPVAKSDRKVSEIDGEFHVYAMRDGELVVAKAGRPFIKGRDRMYALRLSNGRMLTATLKHKVLGPGGWMDLLFAIATGAMLLDADGHATVTVTQASVLGVQDVWDIEVPEIHNYLAAGVINHNSGKSLSTFVEDARAATGCDPFGKYPAKDGNLVVVGRNWQHIGLVAYPMLFKAGAFKIIRDLETGDWRAFRPKTDADRIKETKPAPPLIPPRFVVDTSWVLKNAGYCQKVTLSNGWQINFFSAEGEPPQGFQADLVHFDEDIPQPAWVGEMQARLADRKGRLLWSAMPHSKNDALLGLCERADREAELGIDPPNIKKFVLRFLDNAHIDSKEKEKNIARWSALGVDELRMRAEGEFTQDSILMYPSFNPAVHVLPKAALEDGQVPPDWTRYVAIDPGHAVMAAVFGAVPPDERFLLIYDELYIRNCNALIFGEEFAKKTDGQHFYAFIMDMHGGALRDLGSGRLPSELYSEQLRDRGVRAQLTGHQFLAGSDDITARTGLVRQLLHIRGDGTTKLKFLENATPELFRELRRYKKKVIQTANGPFITDAPNARGEIHTCQCLEYLCAYEPSYHRPPQRPGPEPWYVKWLADKKKRLGDDGKGYVVLGPQRKG